MGGVKEIKIDSTFWTTPAKKQILKQKLMLSII